MDALFSHKTQALITLFIAAFFSIVILVATVVPYVTQQFVCNLGGGCTLSISPKEIKLSPCNETFGIVLQASTRYPISILMKDRMIPLVTYPLVALDSMLTNVDINGKPVNLNMLAPSPSLYENSIKIDYYTGNNVKVVSIKAGGPNSVYLSISSRYPLLTLGLTFGGLISIYSWNATTLKVSFNNNLLNFVSSLTIRTTCPILNVKKVLPDTLAVYVDKARDCKLTLVRSDISFSYYLLKFEASRNSTSKPLVEPVLVKVRSKSFIGLMKLPSYMYFILPYSIYLIVLIVLTIYVTRRIMRAKPEEMTSRRIFYSYLFVIMLFGGLTMHWWDGIQTWIFAGQSPDAVQAYLYTYYQMKYIEAHSLPHVLNYAGYTYPLPWLVYLLYPLKFILGAFRVSDHSFLAFQSPQSFLHSYYDYIYLFPETILTCLSISIYYALCSVLGYEIINLSRNEKMLKAYTLFMYTPYALSIALVWKMFEALFMPLFILTLILLNSMVLMEKVSIKEITLLGFLISVVSTKAYPLVIILGLLLPFLYFKTKETVYVLSVSVLVSLAVLLPIIYSLGFEKYLYVTFMYQGTRQPSVINLFNSMLYPPIPYHVGLTLRKVDLAILGILLTLYILSLIIKYRKCNMEAFRRVAFTISMLSALGVFSIYLVFSPVVSPQNYFFFVFLIFYSAIMIGKKDHGLRRIAVIISLLLFIFILLVYPSFVYFGYPYGELIGMLPQMTYSAWMQFLILFIGKLVSAVVYPLIMVVLILLSYVTHSIVNEVCKRE